MRHLEVLDVVAELVHDALVVLFADPALDLAGERFVFLVVRVVLGGRDGVLEVGEQVSEGLVHHEKRRRLTATAVRRR